jgi:NADPH-dependent curcumin reductase CurA
MVKTADNKTVVLLQHPTGYPQAGVHIGVQYREIDTNLDEGDVLVRNLYISLDPCKVNYFVHNEEC